MFWKIHFLCDQNHAPELCAALEEHVTSVSWFETKDPEIWTVELITNSQPDLQEFIRYISPICEQLAIPVPILNSEEIPDTDWLEATWKNFPPQQIGRYYVYGSHTNPKSPADSVPLEINAATAFGSGEHETTTGCLLTLDDLAKEGRKFEKPLDMGCGSGILAVAIAKTWRIPVIAADNDPESVRVTLSNAILNHCPTLINAIVSQGFENEQVKSHGPYDLIVANILAGPLVDMASDVSANLSPKGLVILSGLLTRHQQNVMDIYKAQRVKLLSLRTLNDWVTLLLEMES